MSPDILWAPWRHPYIKNFKKEKGCLFCRVHKSSHDKKNLVVLRSRRSLVMLNLYPYNNGHLMAAPVRHVRSLELLTAEETTDLMDCVKKAMRMLQKAVKPQGYNIGINIGRIGGAGFDKHLHIHIVPRWQGDTNFMPAVFDTKIISQSLDALYNALTRKK